MRTGAQDNGRRRGEGPGSSLAMIAACFRHQHPEAFGRDPVPGVVLPINVRYGRDEIRQSPPSEALPEEYLAMRGAHRSPDEAMLES